MRRNRWVQASGVALIIGAGLASRSALVAPLPKAVGLYAGDVLWAWMLFLILGFFFPSARTLPLASLALGGAFAVECSQLLDFEWLTWLRRTRLGALVLGRGWVATDLLCYAAGVGLGMLVETAASGLRGIGERRRHAR